MTPNRLERLVRSIAYRRRLKEELPELEANLTAFMQSENLNQISAGGYKVELNGSEIEVSEAEVSSNADQMEFLFKEFQKRSDQNERHLARSETA